MRVAWLGEPASLDAANVGGKTANLGRLATSFRVPPGFCLEASTFDELRSAIDGDHDARRRLRDIVAASYADLARRVGAPAPRVAVRSSAIGEDGADASFAGQHETVLNVAGVDAIADAVLDCWRSVASDRAVAYRRARGIHGTRRIAVLVQLMVDADASAIAFSADPVSGARDVVVVNAARGLGDAIASGTVTPDSYTVRKEDLAIAARSANASALADDDIAAIARLSVQLEEVMGGPVDVECALRSGELHLLQCRPITTLDDGFPVTWSDPEDAKLTWRREDSHMHRAMAPLAIDYIMRGVDYGIRTRAAQFGPPVLTRHQALNGRFYVSVKPLLAPDAMPAELTAAMQRRRALARTIRADWDNEYVPELRAHYAWMRDLPVDRMPLPEAAAAWGDLWRRVGRIWLIHFIVVSPAYAVMEELAQAYEQLVGGDGAEVFAVTQGLAPTLQELERGLETLADAARGTPVGHAIAKGERSLDVLRALPDGPAFARAMEGFLEKHGDVGQEGFELDSLAFRDDPSSLLGLVAQRLGTGVEHPDARFARVRARADEISARARARLGDRPTDLARFEEILAAALAAGPLSEEHNYWIDRVAQANAARLVRSYGARLVKEGMLGAPEEIFLLYVAEVEATLRAPADLRALVAERASELERWRRLPAPALLGAPPSAPPPSTPGVSLARIDLGHVVAQDDPTVLKGVPASAGVASGPARLIGEPGDFAKMRAGDILVCRSSNVSWVPLFTIAAAVVTEVGGALSHAAVVAREFGVPAVVGTGVALSRLIDGERVEVDGSTGIVRRLPA